MAHADMARSEKKPGHTGQWHTQDDDCCVVIESESDDDYVNKKKKAKIRNISSKDEMLEKFSVIEEQPTTQEPPIIIIDDDDDDDNDDDDDGGNNNKLKGPKLTEEDFCAQGQISLDKEKVVGFAISQYNLPDNVVEMQDFGKNIGQSPNDPEANLEIIDTKLPSEEPIPVVEQPKKRKDKTKNIRVTPAVSGRKKRGPSKKKSSAVKVEKCETGKSMCKIPGCFLRDLEKSKKYSGKNFKQNKDELVQKIYQLFNSTVFDQKMPEKIEITWNKKMLRTAGLCTTSETRHPKRERYAKIEISLKVCDSADRLRDTLIHEICHAASWLLDGVRDSHGDAWKYYARKSNAVHPELPRVTRCHNYTINYKINYECTQCKTRVGRYTKSLNTERFICARCRGPLVMLPLTRKDGTPIEPHVRPFAKYVQENYRVVFQGTAGISHGDVMRKLSKDYVASKQKKNP
ncbi:germ cell nuclear acidic protein [Urocitellus parryii]